MKYEDVLLIGGPEDGRRLSVMAGIPSIEIVPKTEASISFPKQSAAITASTWVPAKYHRMSVRSHKGIETAVYVFGDIDPMAALIEGYRKP